MSLLHIALPLILLVFGLILTVIVLQRNYRSSTHRIFSLFLLGMTFWGLTIFGMRASPSLGQALPWERAMTVMVASTSVFFYHFAILYTGIKPRRGIIPAIYLYLLLVIVLSPTNLIVEGMTADPYGNAPNWGLLFEVWIIPVYLLVVLAIIHLFKARRASTSYEEKNRYLYIIGGASFCLLGGLIDLLPALGIDIYPGAIITNILFCLITTLAIVKYHLLDIRIALRKGMAYLLMSGLVAVPYVGIIFGVYHAMGGVEFPLWSHFVLLLALAFLLQPLWGGVQRLVDRLFYRERYDYLKSLERFTQDTTGSLDLDYLCSALVGVVAPAMQANGVHLMLPSLQTGDFEMVASSKVDLPQFSLSQRSTLSYWLLHHEDLLSRSELDYSPQLGGITSAEKDMLEQTKSEVIIPLKVRGELRGILLVGPKLSEQPYSTEDKKMLRVVSSQAAISIDNAYLYALERRRAEELESLNQIKSDFLLKVAHQLKTPLTSIKAATDMLSGQVEMDSTSISSRLMQIVNQGVGTLEREVGDLLELQKIRSAALELHPEPIDIETLIKHVVELATPPIIEKEQTLELDLPQLPATVLIDRKCFEAILYNLLDNANNYTPSGGRIVVGARWDENAMVVAVKDNGPGIPLREQEWVFEPFYRGGTAVGNGSSSGVGLTIAKSLVELQGGKMWLESKVGEGSTFSFSLPLEVAK